MRGSLANIFRLGVKELRSLRSDPVLVFLILWAFTFIVYSVATGEKFEVRQASIAIVDEDRSALSRRIGAAIQQPFFREPVAIGAADIDQAMDRGQYVFVLEIPPGFEADILAGRKPAMQINIDATAMSQAGNGAVAVESLDALCVVGLAGLAGIAGDGLQFVWHLRADVYQHVGVNRRPDFVATTRGPVQPVKTGLFT